MFRSLSIFRKSLFWLIASILFLASFSVFAGPRKFKSCAVVLADGQKVGTYTGTFSSPEQVRAHEQAFKAKAKEDLGIDLKPGMLDTEVLQNAYMKAAKLAWEWGTPEDLSVIFYSLIISEAKIAKAEKLGKHPSEIYGENTVRDFKRMRTYLEDKPEEKYKLDEFLNAEAHRLGNKHTMMGAQLINKIVGPVFSVLGISEHNPFFGGGGNYKPAWSRNRLYYSNLTAEQVDNIGSQLQVFIDEGIFPRAVGENRNHYEYVEGHWASAFAPGMVFKNFSGKRKKNPVDPENPDVVTYNGVFSYPSGRIVREAMEDLSNWINTQIELIKSGNPKAKDPIEVAALAQLAMVYLHPMKDGNGRVTKAHKNKILDIFNLAPDVRYNSSQEHDLDLSVEEFIQRVREGIFYAINLMAEIEPKKTPAAGDSKIGVEVGKFTLDRLPKHIKKMIALSALPKSAEKVFEIGKDIRRPFIFRGNFFQDTRGVHYTYDPATNQLLPLNDWTLVLYGQGGELFVKDTGKNQYNFRKLNPVFEEHVNNNVKLFADMVEGRVDPKMVDLMPYSMIEEQNKGLGTYQFHDIQKGLVNAALATDLDPVKYPYATLAAFRGNQNKPKSSGPTVLQEAFVKGNLDGVDVGDVIAAYTLRRMFLIKLEQDLKKYSPEEYEASKESISRARKNAYIAARTILGENVISFIKEVFGSKPGESNHKDLRDKKVHEMARNHAVFKGLYKFLKNSELFYDDYETAISKVDQTRAVVIRNIAPKNKRWQGLTTEIYQGKMIRSIPFVNLEKALKSADGEIKTANKEGRKFNPDNVKGIIAKTLVKMASEHDNEGNKKEDGKNQFRKELRSGIDKAVKGNLAPFYATRGLEVEYERAFVTQDLHTRGFHPQVLKSTSVDPLYEILLNGQDELRFMAGGVTTFYEVIINEEAVDAKFSPYKGQAEVVENTELGVFKLPFREVFTASEAELWLPRESTREHWDVKEEAPAEVEEVGFLRKMGRSILGGVGRLFSRESKNPSRDDIETGLKLSAIIDSWSLDVGSQGLVPEGTPVYNSRYQQTGVVGQE